MQRKWTQISTITGITPYLRVLDLESLLTAEPSTANDWIYPLKEVLFVSLELPNGITDIALVNIFPNED